MSDDEKKEGRVVSMFEHEARKDAGVRATGESLQEVAERLNVPAGESIALRNPRTGKEEIYEPIWFGCAQCMYQRDRNKEADAHEAPAGHSVYRYYEDAEESYVCGGCDRKVVPIDSHAEMLVDLRKGDRGVKVMMPIRLGFVAQGESIYPEQWSRLHRWWVSGMQAMGMNSGLVPEGAQSDVVDVGAATSFGFQMEMLNPYTSYDLTFSNHKHHERPEEFWKDRGNKCPEDEDGHHWEMVEDDDGEPTLHVHCMWCGEVRHCEDVE